MATTIRRTRIEGLSVIEYESYIDERGSFLNVFRSQDPGFVSIWSGRSILQVNQSTNKQPGTVRGLHLQSAPHSEAKIVTCLSGTIWDVAVDLRRDSSSFGDWYAVELNSSLGNAMLIPEGCAHGFQVLQPNSRVLYLHSGHWIPDSETGIRFDDPQLKIPWPMRPINLSHRDLSLPYLSNY